MCHSCLDTVVQKLGDTIGTRRLPAIPWNRLQMAHAGEAMTSPCSNSIGQAFWADCITVGDHGSGILYSSYLACIQEEEHLLGEQKMII